MAPLFYKVWCEVGKTLPFSHDSTRLASASDDHTVRIWDTSRGKCLRIFEGHSDSVLSVVFSHDSTRLASGSGDHSVRIWAVGSGECVQTLEGSSEGGISLVVPHDSTRTILGMFDVELKVRDADGEGHSAGVLSIAFSHGSILLASASHDSTARIWDISSGECLLTLEGHSDSVSSVAFSPDSTRHRPIAQSESGTPVTLSACRR